MVEVLAASRVLKPLSDEPDLHQLQLTVPAELSAVELRAHVLRTTGLTVVRARCDVYAGAFTPSSRPACHRLRRSPAWRRRRRLCTAGLSLRGMLSAGHLAAVTPLEIDWLNERSAAVDPAAAAAKYHHDARPKAKPTAPKAVAS